MFEGSPDPVSPCTPRSARGLTYDMEHNLYLPLINPIRKNPQQISELCMFEGPPDPVSPCTPRSAGGLTYDMEHNLYLPLITLSLSVSPLQLYRLTS